jgi:hypothetical protein
MIGYNRSFGRSNEFALTYEEMHFNFGASQAGMLTRGASILYGRQISPRLSMEFSVAPMAQGISYPYFGSVTSIFVGSYDSISYRAARWDGTLGFDRTLTGGAGVLAGAAMTMVTGTLGRQLTRRVYGSLTLAYADNRSVTKTSFGVPEPKYDYAQVGFNLTRELGRHISMYLNCYVQRQVSNTPLCQGATCSTAYSQQVAGFGFNWHTRPLKLY